MSQIENERVQYRLRLGRHPSPNAVYFGGLKLTQDVEVSTVDNAYLYNDVSTLLSAFQNYLLRDQNRIVSSRLSNYLVIERVTRQTVVEEVV